MVWVSASTALRPAVDRHERLARARLYLVMEAAPRGRRALEVLEPALAAGVDIVQLRDKRASDEPLVAAAAAFRRACRRHGALLIVNDRPDLVRRCEADGVHLGQDDMGSDEARRLLGPDLLIGLSTHSPEQIDAARSAPVDYLGVGPVHETATKPGRPAVGLGLVRYAAAHAERPFFAIGGIDERTAPDAVAAGAERLAVVRAIRDAPDPGATARALRGALDRAGVDDGP
jgi:thiamine-phosphate pyrophosphorylase